MPNVTVYNRKNEPVVMQQCSKHLFETLDADGNPTGTIVNLPEALKCRSYFEKPKPIKKEGK